MELLSPPFSLHLFGTLTCRVADTEIPRLRTRKGYLLLALLALRSGRPVDRDFLTGTLWPDSDDEDGAMSLRRSLTDLRRALGTEGGRVVSEGHRTVHLSLGGGAFVDVAAFDALYARWEKKGDPANAREALTYYRGSLLEGYAEDFFVKERGVREEHYLTLLEFLAQDALTRQDTESAVLLCRRAERQDPLRETTQRLLYQALSVKGEVPAARRAFRDFRVLLRRASGQAPDKTTVALVDRLKAVPSSPPPLPVPPSPSRLPVPLTPIIGRKEEVAAATRSLRTERLVSLTGSGGVGKTRLALAVGETVASGFPDGARFVDFAPVTDESLLAATILRTLEVEEMACGAEETLLAHLRDKNQLLIIDNCEQVVYAAGVLVGRLLSHCPHLRVLATSRQALGLTGEIVRRVPSLSPADSLTLFAARVESVRGTIDDDSLRLCELLEGVPLALELAAAWTRALPCAEIATRLCRSLDFLISSDPTAPARQRTLQAAHEASFALLSSTEQILLCRLGFFEGGWTYEAAEAICDADLLTLAGLADKSLLTRNGERWTMLETTRQFARAHWANEDKPEVIGRHANFYLRLMQSTIDILHKRSVPTMPLLEKIGIEEANCRRAWEFGKIQGDEAGLEWELALLGSGIMNSHGAEATAWAERVRNVTADSFTPSLLRTRQVLVAGYMVGWRGDHAEMRRLLNIGLEWARDCAEPYWESVAHQYLGLDAVRHGNFDVAHRHYSAQRALLLASGEEDAVAQLDFDLGDLLELEGDSEGATRLFVRCLEEGRRRGPASPLIVRALAHLAHQAWDREDYPTARHLFEEQLDFHRRFDPFGMNRCLMALGRVAGKQGDWTAADVYLSEALTLSRETNDLPRVGWVRVARASVALARGAFADAHDELTGAVAQFMTLREHGSLVVCLQQRARIYAAQGHLTEAVRQWACAEHPAQYSYWPIVGKERDMLDGEIAAARNMLSPETFAAAWADGQATPLEHALADEGARRHSSS